MKRTSTAVCVALVALLLPSATAREVPLERQILWQRTLEDALAIAKAEGRPILVAVNMDGESASERIVRENYRDPKFVASTRPFVCVVASVFRHTPRDHDDSGRRIPCPRLGEVTCGEHMALEPILYDKFLGGDRIAPRHALILTPGTPTEKKEFDLTLLFDLHDIDRKLVEGRENWGRGDPPPRPPGVAAREHRGRLAFEATAASRPDQALAEIEKSGDAGSIEALRIVLAQDPSEKTLHRLAAVAKKLSLQGPLADAVRERLSSSGPFPGAPGLDRDAALLPLLGDLDGRTPETRTLLLGYRVLGATPQVAKARSPQRRPSETLPPADALERELDETERAMQARPDDPELMQRYGKAALDLGRRRIESGAGGERFLLQDAESWLARAAQRKPHDALLAIERARAAYFLGKFADEEKIALEALPHGGEVEIELCRWIGDACARRIAERAGGDPAEEEAGLVRGRDALLRAAQDETADETDWISLASFHGAIGMRREELAWLQAGVERLPESNALREALRRALWSMGRIDLIAAKAEWIASLHPDSRDCAWYAGYAHLLEGEDLRRQEQPDHAIEAYQRGEERFKKSIALKPDDAAASRHYLALCALGRGFAHLLADRRTEASQALVEGIAVLPSVASARDDLDREAIDLVDGALEWRETGVSPVNPVVFARNLGKADPDNAAFWARAVSDSELREALRADGRNDAQEGDRYLDRSIEVARIAVAARDSDENRRTLAQSLTIQGERRLARGELPLGSLVEAARLLHEETPAADAGVEAWKKVAATLREKLGEARPRFRAGR